MAIEGIWGRMPAVPDARRLRAPIPIALVLLLVLVMGACSRSGDGGADGERSPSPDAAPATVSFNATAVQASDAADRPEANAKATEVAGKIVDLMNRYYAIAFVDPEKWSGGQHPELAQIFADAVRAQVAGQIQGLALGDLAPRIKVVRPDRQDVSVKVDVEQDISTPVVSAVTRFEATAETQDEGDGPVKIVHELRVLAAPAGGSFAIAGGTANLTAASPSGALGPARHAEVGPVVEPVA